MIATNLPETVPGAIALAQGGPPDQNPTAGPNPLVVPAVAAPAAPPASNPPPPEGSGVNVLAATAPQGSFAQKLAVAADKLGIPRKANGAPQPGGWARSLVGAAQSALAGINESAIGTENANAPIPAGASGLGVGLQRALQANQTRKQVIQDEKIKRQEAMAHEQIQMMDVDHARRAMAKDDPENAALDTHVSEDAPLLKSYVEGGEGGEGSAPILGEHLTQQEVAQRIQEGHLDPVQMHRFADGKKIIPGQTDKYGNPVYEQTFTVVGDAPTVTVSPTVAERFKDAHITSADGKEIAAGSTMPGWVFGTLSQRLQNRETGIKAVNLARDRADLEELDTKQKIENSRLLGEYSKWYGKAAMDPNVNPEDAEIMAYNHMIRDPQYAGQTPALQNLLFGGPEKAQKAIKDFQDRHDKEFTEPLLKDPSDPITSLTELSKQTVHQMGPDGKPVLDAQGKFIDVPSPAAQAAIRRLDSGEFSSAQIEQHRKDEANEKQKALQEAAISPVLTDQMKKNIDALPADKKGLLQAYPTDVQSTLYSLAASPGDIDFDKVFPNRMYKGSMDMSAQHAIGLLEQLTDGKWSEQNYKVMSGLYKDLTTGKLANNVGQYNNIMQHAANAQDAIMDSYRGKNPEFLNTALNKLEQHGWGAEYANLEEAIKPVRDEFELLMSGGYKPSDEDIKAQQTILSSSSTPAQLGAALKQLAHVGAIRLNQINDQYKRAAGRNIPSLIDQKTLDAAKHLNVDKTTMNYLNSFNVGDTMFQPGINAKPATPQPIQNPATPVIPAGAVGTAMFSDGKEHYVDKSNNSLGVVAQ